VLACQAETPGFVVPAEVFTLTALLAADTLPAASFAFTVNVYEVSAESPLIVAVVPVTVVASVVPLYTS
jgi:hypothetical protein